LPLAGAAAALRLARTFRRMPRPSSGDPKPSLLWRGALAVYRLCASLRLAVVLIFACAGVLGAATFVESAYGTPAVQFGIYGAWWFGLLGALLALNIFCAAAIRYPWTRRQTGFVITHIGLLTLLLGCWLSRRGGIDAQMPIFEGKRNHRAYEDAHHLELAISSDSSSRETVHPIPLASSLGFPGPWPAARGRATCCTTGTA
jgi:hypothetical protein